MSPRDTPVTDPRRLSAVRASGLLDSPPEEAFDRLTALAATLLGARFAFLTAVDDRRSFWKSTFGLPPGSARQNTVEESFCRYVIESGEPLIVEDAANHPVTRENPSIESMGVAAWAGFPVRMRDGRVLGSFCVVAEAPREWTEEDVVVLQALAAAARSEVHLREALAESRAAVTSMERMHAASAALMGAVTVDEIAAIAIEQAVSTLGAVAASFMLLDEAGTGVAAVHAVGFPADVARRLDKASLDDSLISSQAAATGRPVWVGGEEWSRRYPDSARLGGGLASEAAAIPLLDAAGRPLGVLGLLFDDGRVRSTVERSFAETLARQCALALERGRLYDREHRTVGLLQRSLLPGRLPDVPGLEVAARYAPSPQGGRVGGDFYDLFPREDGGWGAVVGDVCGKGPEAAALTVLARQVLRAQSGVGLGPADALARLNATIIEGRIDRFLTAVMLLVRPTDDGFDVRLCLGGHPPPILVRADGTASPVGTPGTLIGVLEAPRLREVTVALRAGDTLVLYTDGVTESRRDGVELGQGRLLDLLATRIEADAEAVADRIVDFVGEYSRGSAVDDIAVLVLRPRGRG